jgi:hypothetical protein
MSWIDGTWQRRFRRFADGFAAIADVPSAHIDCFDSAFRHCLIRTHN